MYISIADEPNATAYFDKLISKFGQSGGIAAAVENVAQEYLELRNTQKAYEKFHYILEHWPESERAIWAKTGMAMSRIRGLDLEAGESELLELLEKYSQDKELPAGVHEIVEEYRNVGAYTEGREVFEYLLKNPFEGAGTMLELQVGVAQLQIWLGEYDKAELAVANLISDFAGSNRLGEGLFQLGEAYCNKGEAYSSHSETEKSQQECYRKATEIWSIVGRDYPSSGRADEAYYFSGICYLRLDQYTEAIACFQEVLDSWPNYKYACHAQLRIGRCYENLRGSGGLSDSEAVGQIEKAYISVVEKYPSCGFVSIALKELGDLYYKNREWDKAQSCYEKYLEAEQAPGWSYERVKQRLAKIKEGDVK